MNNGLLPERKRLEKTLLQLDIGLEVANKDI